MFLPSVEDPSVDPILEAIDGEMASQKQPRVLLFDIGGVCVLSPFQAILDYELSLGVPPGWVNYSISKSAPNGHWHRLEKGDIAIGQAFFDGFNKDIHDPALWKTFYEREQSKNVQLPKAIPPLPILDGESLFNEIMAKSHAPDPWMYPALQNLKESGNYILGALSNTISFPPEHRFYTDDFFNDPLRKLFDVFISSAHVRVRKPDPKIYQLAIKTLDKFAREKAGSTQGQKLGWVAGITESDILFFDDIGENLRAAKEQGFGTFKINLGRTYEAVEELEKVTGLKLEGDRPKIPVKPSLLGLKARI
ncbi:Acyl-CoA dehydrogenase family member 10 [Tolypocladium ophioglossoides CBS 100239]|uniref:Acyl-CoA dehydrogenase family member 10 n=1 Tax=Tolypocladium ophioglossoides (strain CBS 100239) TaxID=1163406 RepID=A0A0L0N4L9_TOLOC|nr:Acyl-CoA dehydrogenase family member 10 [Tolypocladium ophioglossoides CBS 100239]